MSGEKGLTHYTAKKMSHNTPALVYWLDWEKGLGEVEPREAWSSIGHEVHSAQLFAAGAATNRLKVANAPMPQVLVSYYSHDKALKA